MQILYPTDWKDYELLDSGNGKRLERFGKYILVKPDPQCIWKPVLPSQKWQNADAIFRKIDQDKGEWILKKGVPKNWVIQYNDLSCHIKLSSFKHTGIFPEQAVMWNFISKNIHHAKEHSHKINILNLFGYTGLATLAAANAGASVTHIDASKPTVKWARENQIISNLSGKPIRWIIDDVLKFCQRELRRETKYDGIIMDPPVYGHGPEGQIWKFSESFPTLVSICRRIMNHMPLFIIVNAYAISMSSIMIGNVLNDFFGDLNGVIDYGELALQETNNQKRLLSTGIFGRWYRDRK